MTSGRSHQLSRHLSRFVLFGTLALLCVLAVADGAFFLAALLGIGAIFTGRRLLDRQGNSRRELWRWGRENARELSRVAREGQHSDSDTKEFANVTPWPASKRRTLGMTRIDSSV